MRVKTYNKRKRYRMTIEFLINYMVKKYGVKRKDICIRTISDILSKRIVIYAVWIKRIKSSTAQFLYCFGKTELKVKFPKSKNVHDDFETSALLEKVDNLLFSNRINDRVFNEYKKFADEINSMSLDDYKEKVSIVGE